MFTQWKPTILSLTALGLLLGTLAIGNRSGHEANAQGRIEVAAKQPAKVKEQDADREAIAKTVRSLATAFEKGDAKALAAHFTENGEYTTDDGTVFRGRTAIERNTPICSPSGKTPSRSTLMSIRSAFRRAIRPLRNWPSITSRFHSVCGNAR